MLALVMEFTDLAGEGEGEAEGRAYKGWYRLLGVHSYLCIHYGIHEGGVMERQGGGVKEHIHIGNVHSLPLNMLCQIRLTPMFFTLRDRCQALSDVQPRPHKNACDHKHVTVWHATCNLVANNHTAINAPGDASSTI